MNILEEALMKGADCVEIIGLNGEVIRSNFHNDACGDETASTWIHKWPESSQSAALIGLEEALDGRTHRFEAYRPQREQEAWWDVTIIPMEKEEAVIGALAISRDITRIKQNQMRMETQLEKAQQIAEERDLISREMRHRLKNQITAIRSLALMTARDNPSTKNFMESFNRRLMSLSVSQDILSSKDNQPVELDKAIDSILASTGHSKQVTVRPMPEIKIAQQALATMALILGELTTNALKYGALTENDGTVEVDCQDREGILTFTWREDSKTPVVPGVSGSGHQLMKRMSANSGVDFLIEWHETGLICQFGINSRAIG